MKFEEAIKIVGEEYVKKEIERMEEDEVTIKLPIRLKIRMWWMFKIIATCNDPFSLPKNTLIKQKICDTI